MPFEPLQEIQPLPYTKRRQTFFVLLFLFVTSLPFLYLYATGYRLDLAEPNNIVGTGGIYVAAERTGAEIYIDDELVRETRVFRTAFYAQNLDPRTHRVHVQKDGHHTWVKELPVTSHRVTEAQAFNLPIAPAVRVVTQWISATGSPVITKSLLAASTTQILIATSTTATSTFTRNTEFDRLIAYFSGTTTESESSIIDRVRSEIESSVRSDNPTTTTATTAVDIGTTTKMTQGVRLAQRSDTRLYAEWVDGNERMPYYYCAETFPRYSSTTEDLPPFIDLVEDETVVPSEEDVFVHPVQTVPEGVVCQPEIQIGALDETIHAFDFFPGSTDLVLLTLDTGVYVSEIDNRAWQNVQPLMLGEKLSVYIENGSIYVYDGEVIYQIISDL